MDSSQEKYLFLPFLSQGKFLCWKKHLTVPRAVWQRLKIEGEKQS